MNTINKKRVSLLTICTLLSGGLQSIFAETGMREPMDNMDNTEVRTMDYTRPEDMGTSDVMSSQVMEEEAPRKEGLLKGLVKAPGRATKQVAGGVTRKNRKNKATTTTSTQRKTSRKGGEVRNKETRKMSNGSCPCPARMKEKGRKEGMEKREKTVRTERNGY